MNILSLSWFVRNMQSYHILTCRDKTGKIHIFFSHQHAWYPLLDMGISLLRIWCILFGSIFLSLLLPRIRDSSIFWKLTITKLNRSYSFLATLPLELVIIYRYIYIYIIPNPSKSHIVCHIPWYSHDISIPYEWFLGPSATVFFPFILLDQAITAFCFRWDSSISMVPFQKVHGSISSLNHSPTSGNNMK